MNSLKQYFCDHDTVEIARAHPDSKLAMDNKDKVAWVDTLKVENFVRCADCKKVFNFHKGEILFAEQLAEKF